MPTYDYACDACGHAFEREQRITEDAIKKCPKCGKQKARRMISGGSFILKGGGWESDLYSGASNRKAGSSSGESESSSASSASGSSSSDKSSSDKGGSSKGSSSKASKTGSSSASSPSTG
jgi:putative FmdB family regulatory protein